MTLSKAVAVQYGFNFGEVDETCKGRNDLDFYSHGALKIKNALLLPQGGARRRDGLRWIKDLYSQEEGEESLIGNCRFVSCLYEGTTKYLFMILYKLKMFSLDSETSDSENEKNIGTKLYRIDLETLLFRFMGSLTYTDAEIPVLSILDYSKGLLFFHMVYPPICLAITGSTTAELGAFKFATQPLMANEALTPDTLKLTTANTTIGVRLLRFEIKESDYNSFTASNPDRIVDIKTSIGSLVLESSGDAFKVYFEKVVLTSGFLNYLQNGTLVVTGSGGGSAILNVMNSKGDHVKIVDNTIFDVYAIMTEKFPKTTTWEDTDGVSYVLVYLVLSGIVPNWLEETFNLYVGMFKNLGWGEVRGYPRCACFHQNRLWLAGTKDNPRTVWASRVGEYNNFDISRPDLATSAFEVTCLDEGMDAIHTIIGGKRLFLFSDTGEYYIPQKEGEVITPTNVSIDKNSFYGSMENTAAVTEEGTVFFITKKGFSLISIQYDVFEDVYKTYDLCKYASHILKNPVSIVYKKRAHSGDGSYVYVLNKETGNLATLCYSLDNKVMGWSELSTEGTFIAGVNYDDVLYYLISRKTSIADSKGKYKIYMGLEAFDKNFLLDKAKTIKFEESGNEIGKEELETLKYFSGYVIFEDVKNHWQYSIYIPSFGEKDVDLKGLEINSFYLGLSFPEVENKGGVSYRVLVETLPLEFSDDQGMTFGKRKRVSRMFARIVDTDGFVLGGRPFEDFVREFYPDGFVDIDGILGWGMEKTLFAGQSRTPALFTLLSLGGDVIFS